MQNQQMESFQRLKASLFTGPGETAPSLRTILAQQPDHLLQTSPELLDEAVPDELQAYVSKVAMHAYKVTDQDVERLRANGYSEKAIFEITVSVVFGAGNFCLERGMAALEGAKNALKEH